MWICEGSLKTLTMLSLENVKGIFPRFDVCRPLVSLIQIGWYDGLNHGAWIRVAMGWAPVLTLVWTMRLKGRTREGHWSRWTYTWPKSRLLRNTPMLGLWGPPKFSKKNFKNYMHFCICVPFEILFLPKEEFLGPPRLNNNQEHTCWRSIFFIFKKILF